MIVGLVRRVRLLPWPKFFLLFGGRLILFRKNHLNGISGGGWGQLPESVAARLGVFQMPLL